MPPVNLSFALAWTGVPAWITTLTGQPKHINGRADGNLLVKHDLTNNSITFLASMIHMGGAWCTGYAARHGMKEGGWGHGCVHQHSTVASET